MMRRCRRQRLVLVLAVVAWSSSAHARPTPPAPAPPATAAAESGRALIDQAALLLARLRADGSDASALLGVLSAEQRATVESAARDALSLLARADARITDDIAQLERGIMGRDADPAAARRAAEVEAELTRLIDVEQAQRLPFYRGLAHALAAGAADGPPRVSAARQAIDLLAPLAPGSPGADAQRRVYLAAAMLMTGPITEPLAASIADVLAPVTGDDRAGAQAALARRIAAVALDEQWPAIASEPPETTEAAEAAARAMIMRSRTDPARRGQLIAAACRVLLAAPRPADDAAARLRIYAKVAHLIEPGIDTALLPAEAALARAVTLLRASPESAEARALLAIARDRADAPVAVRAAALWELAAISLRGDADAAYRDAFAALEALLLLRPGPPRQAQAAELLDRLGQALAARPGLDPAERDRIERVRMAALADLVGAPPPDADAARRAAWNARLTTLQVRRADPARISPEQIEQFARALPGASDQSPDATELRRAIDELFTAVRQPPAWSVRPAGERMRIVAILIGASTHPDLHLELLAGHTLLELGQPAEAAARLRPLLGTRVDQVGLPTRTHLRLALAGALAAVGDPAARAEALTLLRELTAPFDDQPPTTARPDFYWPAWAATLELLLRDAESVEQTDAIRAQLTRLELIDKSLGGPAHAAAFARIRAAVARP